MEMMRIGAIFMALGLVFFIITVLLILTNSDKEVNIMKPLLSGLFCSMMSLGCYTLSFILSIGE